MQPITFHPRGAGVGGWGRSVRARLGEWLRSRCLDWADRVTFTFNPACSPCDGAMASARQCRRVMRNGCCCWRALLSHCEHRCCCGSQKHLCGAIQKVTRFFTFLSRRGVGGRVCKEVVLQTLSMCLPIQTFQQHWSHPGTAAVPLVRSICLRQLMSLKIPDSLILHVALPRGSTKSACKCQDPLFKAEDYSGGHVEMGPWIMKTKLEWNQLCCVVWWQVLSFYHHSSLSKSIWRKHLKFGREVCLNQAGFSKASAQNAAKI